jgi:Xaa-Pro aminopeptidase
LKKIGFEAEYLSFLEFEKLKDIASSIRLEPTFNLVEELRTIKDEQEILLIRKAVEIATHTFRHLFSLLKEGVYENDLASEAEYFMRKKGAEAAAFATIIASGKHAALPHARVRRKRISLNTPVIIDLGACYQGYSCDLTRTVFLGKMSAKFSKIYQAVLQAQESALAAIKPGVAAREVDRIARESLRSFHLDKFFGHGLGHGIGLEVHEPPSLSPRAEHTLRPKMVVTLEPAVYLPGWGGVRLEDNVLITEEGCDCLSDDLDK